MSAAVRSRVTRRSSLVGVLASLALLGCSSKQAAQPPLFVRTVAVLPLEPASDGTRRPTEDAADAVTAQIYRVLADQTEFRFVPDLTVLDAMQLPEVRRAGDLTARAAALGRQVGADAVVCGRVFRFHDRVGTEYGASEPASVGFELMLVSSASGETVWKDTFDETQQPLTSNLLKWWMFWDAGPRWMSAGELAGLGVERLFDDLRGSVTIEAEPA